MRGHIIAEERFLHQGNDHHLFVTKVDESKYEYRFEVRCMVPGGEHAETVFEKTEDLADQLNQCPNTTIDQLVTAEMNAIRKAVFEEEDLHANDP
jgi:hypothetical protein